MDFDLRRPCAKCPFRQDVPGYLRRERARQIVRSLRMGQGFPCHETTDQECVADGVPSPGEKHCAGALLALERSGEPPGQLARIAGRLGAFDPDQLDQGAPVGTLEEFISHHGEDGEEPEEEQECCAVAEIGCLAPAGVMVGSAIDTDFDREPVEPCKLCGEPVCKACSRDGVCAYCEDAA